MPFPLSYCPDGEHVLQRLNLVFEQRSQGVILASMDVPNRALAEFAATHRLGFCDYPDPEERIQFWDAYLRERGAVHDDTIPSVYPTEMDQGLYGGLVGGDVRHLCDTATGWISSMVAPILKDWTGLKDLSFSADHPMFRRYLRQLEVFVRRAEAKFGISHFILIDGLNFCFELLGATRTYMALLEEPEMVQQAIDLAYDLNVWVQSVFFDRVPALYGGTCSNMAQWLRGRVVSESVDPFHMTSVAYFERWGREPVERIMAHFDGGVVHIHGNGRHLLEAVSTVRGLRCIYLGDDKGFPLAFEVLPQLKARVGDMPLVVGVDYVPFYEALRAHRLPAGVYYRVAGVPDVDTANRCMDLVRA
jgi:hypothetical protein